MAKGNPFVGEKVLMPLIQQLANLAMTKSIYRHRSNDTVVLDPHSGCASGPPGPQRQRAALTLLSILKDTVNLTCSAPSVGLQWTGGSYPCEGGGWVHTPSHRTD